MIVYADTSVLIAWFHADDIFATRVTPWVQENVTDFIWNSALRAELRHNLRQIETTYARAAWNAFRASETSGRLVMGRERLDELLNATDELSAAKAQVIQAGSWDYFHVAAGLAAGVDCFATCDRLQAELAKATGGFAQVRLFKI